MADIEVRSEEAGTFAVRVTDGATTTDHRVEVPEALLDQMGLGEADGERMVRASFEFLLEREPATSILRRFSLDVIDRYFPEYPQEIRVRLSL